MWIAALALSYLVGSIPTAYLFVKQAKGIDIRTVGSGNVGATNAMRTAGRGIGALVFLVDVLKGVAAVLVVPRVVVGGAVTPGVVPWCGLAAVVGHNFPCFLGFRGGKGVATTIGVLLGNMPVIAGIVVGVWIVVFLLCRYVSIASMTAALAIPISQVLLHYWYAEILVGVVLAVLIVVRHRSNIRRLLDGTEHRAGARP